MTTLSIHTFVTDTLMAVDHVIGSFVQTVYQQLMQQYSNLFMLICTLYILLLGYRFITHTLSADISTMSRHLLVLLVVYGLITHWSLYHLFIYNIFTNEPARITQIIVNASDHVAPRETTTQALNQVYSTGVETAQKLLSRFGLLNFFYAIFTISVTFLCCLTALGLLVYAKLAMAIGLAIGPLFLPFILWESTRGWFVSWLRKLFNFSLIPIITVSILVLMLSVIELVLPDLNQQSLQGDSDFFTIILFGGLSLITAFLLKQSLPIASSLSGGVTLAALSHVGSMVSSTLSATGMSAAARVAGKGLKSAGNAMAQKVGSQKQAEGQKKSAINTAVEQGKK